jgi:hypothetical protein
MQTEIVGWSFRRVPPSVVSQTGKTYAIKPRNAPSRYMFWINSHMHSLENMCWGIHYNAVGVAESWKSLMADAFYKIP